MLPPCDPGEEGQADFGERTMTMAHGRRHKVYFFVLVLSHSRYKFVYLSDTPFTTALAIYAHELAFDYFGGMPRKILYDQYRVLIIDLNLGEMILTKGFNSFVKEHKFEPDFCHGLSMPRLAELRELSWLSQAYNLILMGPSGTGKTFIAAGLVHEAVNQGLKAYMLTMEDIMTTIKMKELAPSAMAAYNRLLKAHLIAIDDIMLFPVKKHEAAGFFNLINALHEKTSIIITTNKAPTEWAETLDDTVLASALLDRLLYRCEVIKLTVESYRISNRKTIFNKEQK